MTTPALSIAQALRGAGISTIPVKPDKRPLVDWKKYQTETPTEAELVKWFAKGSGIALVAGRIECLDFDEKFAPGIFARFVKRAEEVGLDQVIGTQVVVQKTPSGGYHLVWEHDGFPITNEKLASKANHETMIETRGTGGYFLIAPSPGYELIRGDWTAIPVMNEDDRDAILELARSFNERPPAIDPVPVHTHAAGTTPAEATPGDDYDLRADIPELLKQYGWKPAGPSGKYWTRPGKECGISASWDVVPNRLFVFSSSTCFDPQHVYRPWHVYAKLACGGDFARAASELRRQGFGAPRPKPSRPLADYMPAVEAPSDDPPGIEGIDPSGNVPTNETEDEKILRLFSARTFNENNRPPPLRPVFTLGGVVISTPGNLTAITAQAKVGKSALVSALTAAAMTDPAEDTDCLTATGLNVAGKGFLYIDTEQAPDDFWHAIDRAKRRAKVAHTPDWLVAGCVTDLSAPIARRAVTLVMAEVAKAFGGIHAVILDGVADLVLDVNDAEECNGLVSELHALAIRYDCPIVCVIHKNPGSDKTRGHLGSQIERKAETNLSLDKEDTVTVVWSDKQRRAPIDKANGPRFRWDDELKMHVTAASGPAIKKTDLQFIELVDGLFKGDLEKVYTWTGIIEEMIKLRTQPGKTPVFKTGEKWLEKIRSMGLVVQKHGSYMLNPNPQQP